MGMVRFRSRRHLALSHLIAWTALAVTVPAFPVAAQRILKTDKPRYQPGETVTLSLTTPESGGVYLESALLWLRGGLGQTGNRFLTVDIAELLRGRPVSFTGPSTQGVWRIELHSPRPGESISVATQVARVSFEVTAAAPAVAAGPATEPGDVGASMPGVSERGMIRMLKPHQLVLGERFEVQVSVPVPEDEAEAKRPLYFFWSDTAYWSDHDLTNGWRALFDQMLGVIYNRQGSIGQIGLDSIPVGTVSATAFATAPFKRPGRYELRLFRSGTWYNGRFLDVLTVDVITGTVADGLTLAKRIFQPGEPIELTAHLPPNRFYQGDYLGPTVVVYPLEVAGRPVPRDTALLSLSSPDGCLHCVGLGQQVWSRDPAAKDPFGQDHLVLPGRYQVRPGLKDKGINQEALFAPKMPGRYQVRLYDRSRSLSIDRKDYVDHALAAVEIVVEATGESPSVLRFVTQRGTAWEEVKAVAHGQPFVLEAKFEPVAGVAGIPTRTVTLEWVDHGAARSRAVQLTCDRTGLCRSELLVLTTPAQPRRP